MESPHNLMQSDPQVARRTGIRLATRLSRRHTPAALIAGGAISVLAGLVVVLTTLAPMFVQRDDSATVIAPASVPSIADQGPITVGAADPSSAGPKPAVIGLPSNGPRDGISFEMSIPVLRYSAMVYQGVSASALSHGPGHYPTTPWPGQAGNIGVAAHNVYWLSFDRLKVGDSVEIRTASGDYVYQITGSKITDPNDRTVLVQTADHRLTLTTCYPLWAGAYATKRLIFTAEEIGGVG